MKNKFFNKLVSFSLALLMGITPMLSAMPVYANTETNLNVEVQATTVNVTLPLNVNVNINPNVEKDNGGFVYGDVLAQNGTKAPILLSINDFKSTDAPFENTIAPTDLPDGLEWEKLNAKQTMQYFSMGIKPIEYNSLDWAESVANDYTWALDSGFTTTALGVLDSESNGYLGLDAFYGYSFKEAKTFSYKATFVAELYDGEVTSQGGSEGGSQQSGTYTVDPEESTPLNYEITPGGAA